MPTDSEAVLPRQSSGVAANEPQKQAPSPFRPDIEGLRAIAVGLVLLFHAGIPWFAGGYVGVDVFFVISGFLITGLIVKEVERTGSLGLRRFYARRIRRLLPAAALTLTAVAGMTFLFLPVIRWAGVAKDTAWSALYVVNWRFASRAVDYLAAEEAASPVQHFWSLSVEEQFYLIWPFVVLGLALVAHRRGLPIRRVIFSGLVGLGLASFTWSLLLTQAEPGRAYFVTTTRIWELALGGAVALAAPVIGRFSGDRVAAAAAWFGLLGILASSMLLDSTTAFPGYAAAFPTVSTAIVIAAGIAQPSGLPMRVLGVRPMLLVGGMSYSLYLWHWPVIVVFDAVWGPLEPWQGMVAIVVSVLPAWLSFQFVENRWRDSVALVTPPTRGLLFGVGLTVAGVAAAATLAVAIPDVPAIEPVEFALSEVSQETSTGEDTGQAEQPATLAVAIPDVPAIEPVEFALSEVSQETSTGEDTGQAEQPIGPIQPGESVQVTAVSLNPDPLVARDDRPEPYKDGCHQDQFEADVLTCSYGDPASAVDVVLVGDSHAAQWMPPLNIIAIEQGWHLETITKSACQLADDVIGIRVDKEPYESCVAWNANVTDYLIDTSPDLIVLAGAFWPTLVGNDGLMTPAEREAALANGLESTLRRLSSAGLEVLVMRDVPHPDMDVAECVAENRSALDLCAVDRAEAVDRNTPHAIAAERVGVGLIDLTDQICLESVCPAVIKDTLVWRDSHHLTPTYASLLSPVLRQALSSLAPYVISAD